MKRIAFLDTVHAVLWDRLTQAGCACEHAENLTREEILTGALADHVGIVLRSRLTLDAAIMDAMPRLKWIARSGAGLDNIDIETAEIRGIHVFSSPEGNATAVGEHAIGQLLMLLHQLAEADRHVRSGGWDREAHRGIELEARTVGIIGFGNMGQSFAKRLMGFGCRVLVYDKYLSKFNGQYGVQEVDMKRLNNEADIISLHVPLTSETQGMVNDQWISQFKKNLPFGEYSPRGNRRYRCGFGCLRPRSTPRCRTGRFGIRKTKPRRARSTPSSVGSTAQASAHHSLSTRGWMDDRELF